MSQWLSKQSENGYVSLSQLNSTERLLACQPLVSLLDQTSREVALLKNWARIKSSLCRKTEKTAPHGLEP